MHQYIKQCCARRRPLGLFFSLIFSDLNLPSLVLTYLTLPICIYLDLLEVLLEGTDAAAWSREHKKRAPVHSRALFRVRRWVPPVINTQVYITRGWMGFQLFHSRSIEPRIIESSERESTSHNKISFRLLLRYWNSLGEHG